MIDRVLVRHGVYYDSVTLMLASRRASDVEGVERVDAVAATELNLQLLAAQSFDIPSEGELTPNDLVIALRAVSEEAADQAVAEIEHQLAARASEPGGRARALPRSLRSAVRERAELSMAFLSLPGRYVAYEGAAALEAGLHVFCFSDGASLEEEIMLKRSALERGLLFLGPDCGTAILDGVALGFANAVERGPIGVVGASGTGIQEVTCLLDTAGIGVSHAIGVGGRDLHAGVDGMMTIRAIEMLAADSGTSAIVVVSKPPDPNVAREVAAAAGRTGKPTVLALLGTDTTIPVPEGVEVVCSLESSARRAAELAGAQLPDFTETAPIRAGGPGAIRGFFVGGSLCAEAMTIIAADGEPVRSNAPLRDEWRLDSLESLSGDAFIDFGADELTQGRPHPMIDPALRDERVEREAEDPSCAVVLVDVVLGYGAHADPAGELAPHIERALAERSDLAVVVSLCGAEGDPQGLEAQAARLSAAGARVTRSNAHAARLALEAARASVEAAT